MAARDAAIRRRFTTEQGFVDVMYEIGVGENERNITFSDSVVFERKIGTKKYGKKTMYPTYKNVSVGVCV